MKINERWLKRATGAACNCGRRGNPCPACLVWNSYVLQKHMAWKHRKSKSKYLDDLNGQDEPCCVECDTKDFT